MVKKSAAYILAKQKLGKRSKFSIKAICDAARELGRNGGKVGGPARANKLTAKQTREIAIHAANMRWGNYCNCSYCK